MQRAPWREEAKRGMGPAAGGPLGDGVRDGVGGCKRWGRTPREGTEAASGRGGPRPAESGGEVGREARAPRTLPSRQQILQSPEWVRPPGSFFSEEPLPPRWGGASSLAVRLVVLQMKARVYSQ